SFWILNYIYYFLVFIIRLVGYFLIFSGFILLNKNFEKKLLPFPPYKKRVLFLSKRAKKGINIEKNKQFGFFALMLFVMVPFPGTGAYMGTIAAFVTKMERKRAFVAVSLGVLISCIIMTVGAHLGNIGLDLL